MAAGQPEKQGPTNGVVGEAESAVPREDVWDEERLENALKTLKEMHIQVCHSSPVIQKYLLRSCRLEIYELLSPVLLRLWAPNNDHVRITSDMPILFMLTLYSSGPV